MLRLPIRSLGTMILFIAFWVLLGSNVVSGVGNAQELGDKVKITETNYEITSRDEDSVSLVVIAIVQNDNEKDVSVTLWIDVLSSKNKVLHKVVLKDQLVAKSSKTKLTANINIGVGEITVPVKDKALKVRGKILEVKEAT